MPDLTFDFVAKLYERFEWQRLSVHGHHLAIKMGAIPRGTVVDIGQLDLSTMGIMQVSVNDLLRRKLDL